MCLCSILCPNGDTSGHVTFWAVMSKVRLESFMWVSNNCALIDLYDMLRPYLGGNSLR